MLYVDFCKTARLEELTGMQKSRQIKKLNLYMSIKVKRGKIIIDSIYDDEYITMHDPQYNVTTRGKFLIEHKYKNRAGIYKIQLGNVVYVGQTTNFIKRFYQHNAVTTELVKNNKTKKLLDDGGYMEMLELEDDLDNRLRKERKYTEYYIENGYKILNNTDVLFNERINSENNHSHYFNIRFNKSDRDRILKLLNENGIEYNERRK